MFLAIVRFIACAVGITFIRKAFKQEMTNPESRAAVAEAKARMKKICTNRL